MKSWFFVRSYPNDLIEAEMKKIKFTSKNRNTKRTKSLKVVPFVITYHLKLKSMNKVIFQYLDLLLWIRNLKGCLPLKPIISFRSARKQSSVVKNGVRSAQMLMRHQTLPVL